jgi:hypothetical protein
VQRLQDCTFAYAVRAEKQRDGFKIDRLEHSTNPLEVHYLYPAQTHCRTYNLPRNARCDSELNNELSASFSRHLMQ